MGRLQTLWHSRFKEIFTAGIVPVVLPVVLGNMVLEVHAQVISAQDEIQTQVVQQGNRFDIVGGTTADNATLLFHSFEQFDLDHDHTANFQVASGIEAVFSRITNGVPSQINGVIELRGSPASLYLMNPAGVLFGADAALNLAGDFTVLTAERLHFSQGNFGIAGDLNGVQGPILQLDFNTDSPGTVVNLGDLRVGAQRSLSLIGHSVVNQGTLRGGAINVVAVGHHGEVNLTDGFQFGPIRSIQPLPPWLTSTGAEHATTIELDQDGTLRLTGSPLTEVPLGVALVGGELITTNAPNAPTNAPNRIQIVGEQVVTMGATLEATAGGEILIGDDRGQGTLPTAQSTFIDAASTLTADGEVGGQIVIGSDEHTQVRGAISAQGVVAGGTVEIIGREQLYVGGPVDLRSQSTPGTLSLISQDLEIRAGSAPSDINLEEPSVLYEDTLESAIIGDVNLLFQADNNITIDSLSDNELTFVEGTGYISFLADADGDGQGRFTMASGHSLRAPGRDMMIAAADMTVGAVDTSVFSAVDNVVDAGDIDLKATAGNIISGHLTSTARGTLNNTGRGGNISLSAAGSVMAENMTAATNALSNNGRAGEISITAQTGEVIAGVLDASTSGNNNIGPGGDIQLTAADSITIGDSLTSTSATTNNLGDAGSITLTSQTGDIVTASLAANTSADSSNTGAGGLITLTASQGTITSQQITSNATSPNLAESQGGNVQLEAASNVVVDFISAVGQGQGGDIDVSTQQSFRAIDTIPNTDTSLLTTGDGTIRLAYGGELTTPFTLGDGNIHGTVGDITTELDTLAAPQTVTAPISLGSIELVNLFEPAIETPVEPIVGASTTLGSASSTDLSSLAVTSSTHAQDSFSVPPTVSPVSSGSLTAPELTVSETLSETLEETLGETLDIVALETVNTLNPGNELSGDRKTEREREISQTELIWAQTEMAFSQEFAKALNVPIPASPSLQTTQQTLTQVANTQNIIPALMYIRLKDTHVELMLVKGDSPPVYHPVAATAAEVKAVVERFHQTITNPILRPAQYLPEAQQLYDWLVRPMLGDLQAANIDHIGFVVDTGLRSLPLAALHDGEHFLIENYTVGLLPSVGLTPLEPALELSSESDLAEYHATLAMGVANFEEQADLAAVPFELDLISQRQRGEYYLDHEATLDALQQRLAQGNFTSMHLATHAVFEPGNLEASYVQLWDRSVEINQLQALPLDAIDFLILSACATALGDEVAEFGFAGLAVNVGVQTVLASLWSISDEGTLGLMSEFYRALEQPLTRSAALRQAQLAMLQGQVGIVNGTVYDSSDRKIGHLPSLDASGSWDFSHPAYWSGFTMIGNPW